MAAVEVCCIIVDRSMRSIYDGKGAKPLHAQEQLELVMDVVGAVSEALDTCTHCQQDLCSEFVLRKVIHESSFRNVSF